MKRRDGKCVLAPDRRCCARVPPFAKILSRSGTFPHPERSKLVPLRRIPLRVPLALLALLSTAAAQTTRHTPTTPEKKLDELPITRVALYKNGVGFFEHAGRVTGDQSVTIDFTSAQLNDVLQSLTAIDLAGGRISGAGYNSTTPLDQQLKTLPLALTADPTDVDFYNAIRGARVQVTAPGASITGRLLSIDLRSSLSSAASLLSSRSAAEGSASPTPTPGRRYITVISDTGQVRTLELTAAVSVTLLDTALHTDVTRYLELLASTRNQGLRHLTLLDRGPEGSAGKAARELRVSYISEVPVWKSTYRILFTNTAANAATDATLQGWSVVDNTTGSDWTNVHLDLIAGAPQSFIQPLSTPYYTRRPEIALPAEAQLEPQTHDSGDDDKDQVASTDAPNVSANETVQVTADAAPMPQAVMSMKARSRSATVLGVSGGAASGIGPGSGGNMGGGVFNYAQAAQASITPQTTTSAFDDFFEYSLTDPITIRKNESALVPILQTKLPVERVTLWSPSEPVALRALWITNASSLTLDRGSFSIVENGSFGGEGLLDPIHPGEKRLLSYAADQAVRVTTSQNSANRRVVKLTIAKGTLIETSIDTSDLVYDIRNAAPNARTVIVEQPIRSGWTLESDPKPAETTPTAYRFRVAAKPGETAHLKISERHNNFEYIRLIDQSEDQLRLLLTNAKASPAVLAALQPVFDAHNAVVALDQQITVRTNEVAEITKDQDRLRENMKALKGTAEERALLQRYTGELNQQEDRLAALRTQLADLHKQREAADADFQVKLNAVAIDETV